MWDVMRAAALPPTASTGGVPAPSVYEIIKTPALGPPLASAGCDPTVTASKHGGGGWKFLLGQMLLILDYRAHTDIS